MPPELVALEIFFRPDAHRQQHRPTRNRSSAIVIAVIRSALRRDDHPGDPAAANAVRQAQVEQSLFGIEPHLGVWQPAVGGRFDVRIVERRHSRENSAWRSN